MQEAITEANPPSHKLRSTCMLAILVPVLLSIFVNPIPREQPSFDCLKAASLSEKTICATAELSRLDFQLGQTWKTLLDGKRQANHILGRGEFVC